MRRNGAPEVWMKWDLLHILTESSSQADLKQFYPWVSALCVLLETADMSLINSLKGHSLLLHIKFSLLVTTHPGKTAAVVFTDLRCLPENSVS